MIIFIFKEGTGGINIDGTEIVFFAVALLFLLSVGLFLVATGNMWVAAYFVLAVVVFIFAGYCILGCKEPTK